LKGAAWLKKARIRECGRREKQHRCRRDDAEPHCLFNLARQIPLKEAFRRRFVPRLGDVVSNACGCRKRRAGLRMCAAEAVGRLARLG